MARERCLAPRCTARAVHRHHVVYEQHVERAGGDLRDPRNLVGLCVRCHLGGQHQRQAPLPIAVLPDAVFEFAVELLGAGAAFEYLARRYAGRDPRHDALVA